MQLHHIYSDDRAEEKQKKRKQNQQHEGNEMGKEIFIAVIQFERSPTL